jgi:hypothetical protein
MLELQMAEVVDGRKGGLVMRRARRGAFLKTAAA